MAKQRIMLADDHAVLRAGIRTLLDLEADMEVIGAAEDGPLMNGVDAIRAPPKPTPTVASPRP